MQLLLRITVSKGSPERPSQKQLHDRTAMFRLRTQGRRKLKRRYEAA
jgi:hypothetical protein